MNDAAIDRAFADTHNAMNIAERQMANKSPSWLPDGFDDVSSRQRDWYIREACRCLWIAAQMDDDRGREEEG